MQVAQRVCWKSVKRLSGVATIGEQRFANGWAGKSRFGAISVGQSKLTNQNFQINQFIGKSFHLTLPLRPILLPLSGHVISIFHLEMDGDCKIGTARVRLVRRGRIRAALKKREYEVPFKTAFVADCSPESLMLSVAGNRYSESR